MMNDARPPKKLLCISLYSEMGGGEFGLFHLLKNLDRSRFTPVLMLNKRGPLAEFMERIGVEVVLVPFEVVMLKRILSPKTLGKNVAAAKAIKQYIAKNDIGAVVCSDILSMFLLSPSLLSRSIKVIYNVIFYYEPLRVLLLNIFSFLFIDHIIVLSNAMNDDLTQRTIGISAKIKTVYWGVDRERFFPRSNDERVRLREKFQFPSDKKVIGFIGRYEVWKGHLTFIDAAEELLRERKDLLFLIVGGAMTESVIPQVKKYHDDVMHRIESSPFPNHFLVWNHRDDIPDVMAAIDLFVCPSEREPYGLVVLEALATGIPVVATNTVGALEVLKDVPEVYAAEQEHATMLSHQIKTALNDSKTQTLLSFKINQILTSVSWDRYSRIIESL